MKTYNYSTRFLMAAVVCGECDGRGETPNYDYLCEKCDGVGRYFAPVTATGFEITNPAVLDPFSRKA